MDIYLKLLVLGEKVLFRNVSWFSKSELSRGIVFFVNLWPILIFRLGQVTLIFVVEIGRKLLSILPLS